MFDSAMAVQDYLLGGRGILTVRSVKSGKHFTFKIGKPARSDGAPVLFVSLLVSRDDYRYLGHVSVKDMAFTTSRNAPSCMSKPAAAFSFLLSCLRKGALHADLEVRHEGTCGCCGRKITTPTSLDAGIGPECLDRLGGKAPRLARAPRAPDPYLVAALEQRAREKAATEAYWRAYRADPNALSDLLDRFAAVHC